MTKRHILALAQVSGVSGHSPVADLGGVRGVQLHPPLADEVHFHAYIALHDLVDSLAKTYATITVRIKNNLLSYT